MGKLRSLAALLAACLLAGCTGAPESATGAGGSTTRHAVFSAEVQFQPPAEGRLVAAIETSRGTIHVVLFPEYAPLAVDNFRLLAERGVYDGTLFHRVIRDFVIQGGDPTGTGTGGTSAWNAPFRNEYSDKMHHYAGALCMAGADGRPDTNMSQFYIVAAPQDSVTEELAGQMLDAGFRQEVADAYLQAGGLPYLDYTGTVFGQVYAGMDVVDEIAALATGDDDRPRNEVHILSVTISAHTGAAPPAPAPSSLPPEHGNSEAGGEAGSDTPGDPGSDG